MGRVNKKEAKENYTGKHGGYIMKVTVQTIHKSSELYTLSLNLLYRIVFSGYTSGNIQDVDMWIARISFGIEDNSVGWDEKNTG